MKTYEHITRFGRNCGLALLVPDASHNYGRSTTLTIAFYKRSWFWEMRSLFIFAKHTRARLLDCTTIMSNYLTIQFVVNARASKLQVMLAPPTKDIFLGLRQQVCSLLSQLYGWFLHTCNLTAWWKTQGTKYHITWKSALLWPNLLGLFCQNPLQVTVFCCLKQTTRWCTVSDTLIVDLRRNIIRVGSARSALYLFQTPPHTPNHYSHNRCWFTQKESLP